MAIIFLVLKFFKSSGFTSGTISGISSSILKWLELSITIQFFFANSGAHFSDVLDPAEKSAILTLEISKFSISSTTNSSSPKSTFEPALLLEATGKIFLDLNFLS